MKLMKSKKYLIALVLGAAITSFPAMAQNDNDAKSETPGQEKAKPSYSVSMGIKLGPTLTNLNGDAPVLDSLSKTSRGVTGGGFVKYDVKEWMAFQFELLYHRMGVTSDQVSENGRDSYWGIHYFKVPVLAKFQYPINDMFFPNVSVGPTFSYLITDQADGRVGGAEYNEDKISSPRFKDQSPAITGVNKWDVGALFSAGLDMEFGRFFLGADIRYEMGFVNVAEFNEEALDSKNTASSFVVGLGINF